LVRGWEVERRGDWKLGDGESAGGGEDRRTGRIGEGGEGCLIFLLTKFDGYVKYDYHILHGGQ
jgi:hypothetical protein